MEKTSYFSTNDLQGENIVSKSDFWQIYEPLPKVILSFKKQDITTQSSKNEESLK